MTDLIIRRPFLDIYFDNREPITARQLSTLLNALSADYRRLRRNGNFVVESVETGSLRLKIIGLVGAVATNVAADGIVALGEYTSTQLQAAQHGLPLADKKTVGAGSAEAMLDTAVKSKSPLKLSYSNAQGEHMTLEMDAPQARHALMVMKSRDQSKRLSQKHQLGVAQSLASALPSRGTDKPDEEIESLLRRLGETSKSGDPTSDDSLKTAVGIIVATMEARGDTLALDDIQTKLEVQGLHQIAQMIRDTRNRPKGTMLTLGYNP